MRLGNRVLVSGMTVLIGIMLLVVAGCDDTSTPTIITGSLTNPEFVVVQEQLDNFVDSTIAFFENGLNTINGIADDGVIIPQYVVTPGDHDSWDTTYTNGWHVIKIVRNESEQWQVSLTDSIQYRKNGVAQEDFTGRDQLLYRHHWAYDVADSTVSHTTFNGNANYTFSNLMTSQAMISGSRDFVANNKDVTADSTVWRKLTFTADINNITLRNLTHTGWCNCPVDGSVSTAVEMVYTKDDGEPITTTWNATFTFNNGSMTASITCGNTVWSYTSQVCNIPG